MGPDSYGRGKGVRMREKRAEEGRERSKETVGVVGKEKTAMGTEGSQNGTEVGR